MKRTQTLFLFEIINVLGVQAVVGVCQVWQCYKQEQQDGTVNVKYVQPG